MLNPLKNCRHLVVEASAIAGTTDLTSDGVDCANAEAVQFIAHLGALTATQQTRMYLEQSDDDGVGDAYSTLEGSATPFAADGDSNKLLICSIVRPRKRFVRAILDRGTANAVLNGITAIVHFLRNVPTTQAAASVSQSKEVISPAEGTP